MNGESYKSKEPFVCLKKVAGSDKFMGSYLLTFPVRNGKWETFPTPSGKTDKLTKSPREENGMLTLLAIPRFFFLTSANLTSK